MGGVRGGVQRRAEGGDLGEFGRVSKGEVEEYWTFGRNKGVSKGK